MSSSNTDQSGFTPPLPISVKNDIDSDADFCSLMGEPGSPIKLSDDSSLSPVNDESPNVSLDFNVASIFSPPFFNRHQINTTIHVGSTVVNSTLVFNFDDLGTIHLLNHQFDTNVNSVVVDAVCSTNDAIDFHLSTAATLKTSVLDSKMNPLPVYADDVPSGSRSKRLHDGTLTSLNLSYLTSSSNPTGLPLVDSRNIIAIPGGFTNITTIYVPRDVATILSFGPRFVPPHPPTLCDFIDQLYQVQKVANRDHIDPSLALGPFLSQTYTAFINALVAQCTPINVQLSKMLNATRQFLNSHPELCIVQSDKNKSMVLMKVDDYRLKMDEWILKCMGNGAYKNMVKMDVVSRHRNNWYSKYKRLTEEIKVFYQGTIDQNLPLPFPKKYLRDLVKRDVPGASFPYLYGVVKVHKEGHPCRPICCTRPWYSYPLQKIINYTLAGVTEYLLYANNVGDISVAASNIRSVIPHEGFEFAKLDVTDMYTNMDRATILSVIHNLVQGGWYARYNRIPPNLLMRCLELTLGETSFFTYNSSVFSQVRGLPQGACDSGLLATIQLDHFLQNHHNAIFVKYRVSYWWKYVDDILLYLPVGAITGLQQELMRLGDLEYTVEREEEPPAEMLRYHPLALSHISFLDLSIFRSVSSRVLMCTYRKPMASDRMCHYLSHCPLEWKVGTVTGYINRVLARVSNPYLLHDLLQVLKMFASCMYPTAFIDPILSDLLTYHHITCLNVLTTVPISHLHPVYNLGGLAERIEIVKHLAKTLKHERTSCRLTESTFVTPYTPQPNRVLYHQSSKYICEEHRTTIKRIYRELGLGVPIHSNGESLFQKLKLSLVDPDPTLEEPVSTVQTYIIECGDCPTLFFISGVSPIPTLFDDCLRDPANPMNIHLYVTGHTIPQYQQPLCLFPKPYPHVPAGQWLSVMRMIYNTLGYECATSLETQMIPQYVRRGAVLALQKALSESMPIRD